MPQAISGCACPPVFRRTVGVGEGAVSLHHEPVDPRAGNLDTEGFIGHRSQENLHRLTLSDDRLGSSPRPGPGRCVEMPRLTNRETRRRTIGSAPRMKERSEPLVDESDGPVSEQSNDAAGTPLESIDSVQEADEESFPASDAPSSWAGGA